MPSPHGFIEQLAQLSRTGKPFAAVTLVEAVGSTPQDTGAKMLVDAQGLCFGTVGGGRIENQAIEHAQSLLASAQATTQLVEWNLQRDVGMTCGGVVKLFFESYNVSPWRIVLYGAGHVAQALVRVLLQLECEILCLDPRQDWLDRLPQDARLTARLLGDQSEQLAEDGGFAICMTMGHRSDLPILKLLLQRPTQPSYLGVIGSAAKRKVLVRELTEAGIPLDRVESFRCPIGLPLGSNQPGEIAVSIAAELIQVRDQQRRSI